MITTLRTKKHYQYIITETELGYEVKNIRNGNEYFVSHTVEKGMGCNCPDTQINKAPMCKHKKKVIELFFKKD